jgi:hypothetical protein
LHNIIYGINFVIINKKIKVPTMKKLFVLAVLSLFLMSVSAQDNPYVLVKSNEFGMHLGATTGMGLSYRHWFNKIGFQLTALPVKTNQNTFISAGATALYSFYDSPHVMVFGYLGSHYLMRDMEEEIYDPFSGTTSIDKVHQGIYNIGIGPGFAFGGIVRFNLMVGYGFFDIFGKLNMFPTGEMGLYFRF